MTNLSEPNFLITQNNIYGLEILREFPCILHIGLKLRVQKIYINFEAFDSNQIQICFFFPNILHKNRNQQLSAHHTGYQLIHYDQ